MKQFLEALADRVLVCDGAMGTMLYAKGVFINKSFDALNLSRPDLVEQVHHEYVRAGADIVETNTFGANRIKLGSFGVADSLREINLEGARIARRAAGGRAFVAGSIGPLGIRIEPWGKTGVDEAREYFREQAQALLEGGVDLFVLETFRDLNEIGAAIDAVRLISDLPIVAQMTTEEDGNSLDGTPPERFAPELEARGATVIGVNCAVGPAPMLETGASPQADVGVPPVVSAPPLTAAPLLNSTAVQQTPAQQVEPVADSATASAHALSLSFSSDSWVEITDGKGKRLFYDLAKRGSQQSFQNVTPPTHILLGNASAVTVDYNGKRFDHSRYHRDNVARFSLEAE